MMRSLGNGFVIGAAILPAFKLWQWAGAIVDDTDRLIDAQRYDDTLRQAVNTATSRDELRSLINSVTT